MHIGVHMRVDLLSHREVKLSSFHFAQKPDNK